MHRVSFTEEMSEKRPNYLILSIILAGFSFDKKVDAFAAGRLSFSGSVLSNWGALCQI
jgi:hypothetical protein